MYDDFENPIDKAELIICEHCTHTNVVNRKVLERREQRNRHVSLENPVFKKWKKFAVENGCDLNEALKVMFYKIETGKSEKDILANLNDFELLEEVEA